MAFQVSFDFKGRAVVEVMLSFRTSIFFSLWLKGHRVQSCVTSAIKEKTILSSKLKKVKRIQSVSMPHEFELIKALKYSSHKKYAVLFGAGNQRLVL